MTNETMTRTEKGWLYQPKFPDHWEHCSLYSMANWVNGLAFREINFSTSGMPIIKIAEIKEGISSQTKFTKQTFDESVRVRPGDLLFSWSGQPETSIDAFRWSGPEGWLNQHVFRVTPIDGINPIFFYYLLHYLKPHFIGIARNKQTTGLGHVTKRDLENIQAAYPVLSEQLAIANILGTLDGKIQLNKQMNKTLEDIAQAIFKRWFIDFEFPNENGEPYKSSGGEMVESELGMIPKGWYVDNLGKYVEVVKGCSYSSIDLKPSDTALVTLKSINRGGGFNRNGYKEYVGKYKDNQIVKEGDILLAQTDLTQNGDVIGRPAFFHGETTYSKVIASLDLQIIRPLNGFSKYFVFYLLDTDSFHEHALSHTNGTTVLHLDRNAVSEFRCIIPKNDILDQFDAVVSQILSLENNNLQEINYLTEIRDLLLPKLMTGKIRVPLEEQNVQ